MSISEPDGELRIGGKVDRVDGWVKDGKLYLRVVDYKSGKKAFDLSAVKMGLGHPDAVFLCNFLAMELSIVGLLAVAYVAELATASVPMLVLVQNGVGAGVLTPIISLLIILGAISTAVNMISGIVTRCVNAVERRMGTEKKKQGHLARNAAFTLLFTFLSFAIAQFGLMAVVSKGYSYLGYVALLTQFIPFIVHFIGTRGKDI